MSTSIIQGTLLLEGIMFASVWVLIMLCFEFGLSFRDVERFRKRAGGKEAVLNGIR